jgi:tetratricopeptide (TPR) repeat protein
MADYVTCAACGARIRGDRERCLRCFEVLVAAPEPKLIERLTREQQRLVAGGAAVVVLLVGGLAWRSRPTPIDAAAPAQAGRPGAAWNGNADRPPAAAAAERPATALVAPPGAFLDTSRAATASFLTGNLQQAREQFEAALAIKPDDPEALNSVGQILDRQGDISGAIARFEKAISIAPDRWAYHFNLAHAAGRQGDWTRAVDEYREAVRRFPDDYATQFNYALALQRGGDPASAIPEFEKAIRLAPAEASFHLALGNSLQAVGRLPEARKAFETYLQLEPSAPDVGKVKAHIETLRTAISAKDAAPPGSP